jgi:hypothetical protein
MINRITSFGMCSPAEYLLKSLSVYINNLRMDRPILMKYGTGEFYTKLLSHFNLDLDWAILTTILYDSITTFWAYFISYKNIYNYICNTAHFTIDILATHCCSKL